MPVLLFDRGLKGCRIDAQDRRGPQIERDVAPHVPRDPVLLHPQLAQVRHVHAPQVDPPTAGQRHAVLRLEARHPQLVTDPRRVVGVVGVRLEHVVIDPPEVGDAGVRGFEPGRPTQRVAEPVVVAEVARTLLKTK